jgi:hypothetical protein
MPVGALITVQIMPAYLRLTIADQMAKFREEDDQVDRDTDGIIENRGGV